MYGLEYETESPKKRANGLPKQLGSSQGQPVLDAFSQTRVVELLGHGNPDLTVAMHE